MINNQNNDPLSKTVTIINDLGLHARSAAKIAQEAGKASSKVWIKLNNETVDAKSTIDVLTLACPKGATISVSIENKADVPVLESIVKLVENGFGEHNN